MTSVFFQPCEIANNQFTNITTQIQDSQSKSTLASSTKTNEQPSNQHYIDEIVKLRNQVRALQHKQDVVEAEKEELVNQVCDLKALMKRVAKEGEKNLHHVERQNYLLGQRLSSLQGALEQSFEHCQHFDQVLEYWANLDCAFGAGFISHNRMLNTCYICGPKTIYKPTAFESEKVIETLIDIQPISQTSLQQPSRSTPHTSQFKSPSYDSSRKLPVLENKGLLKPSHIKIIFLYPKEESKALILSLGTWDPKFGICYRVPPSF